MRFLESAMFIGILSVGLTCSEHAKMSGGSAKQSPSSPNPEAAPVAASASEAVMTPTPEPEKVGGNDVLTSCDACMKRAAELTAKLGFVADKNKAFNLGFYKIPPEKGLCDIHFMSDLKNEIKEHNGVDSLLGDQIAIYCPCDCGWKEPEEPFGPMDPMVPTGPMQ